MQRAAARCTRFQGGFRLHTVPGRSYAAHGSGEEHRIFSQQARRPFFKLPERRSLYSCTVACGDCHVRLDRLVATAAAAASAVRGSGVRNNSNSSSSSRTIAVYCPGFEKPLGSMRIPPQKAAINRCLPCGGIGSHRFSKSKESIHTQVLTVVQSYDGRELSISISPRTGERRN